LYVYSKNKNVTLWPVLACLLCLTDGATSAGLGCPITSNLASSMLALKDLVKHLLPLLSAFLVLPIDPVSVLFLAILCLSTSGTILRSPWLTAKYEGLSTTIINSYSVSIRSHIDYSRIAYCTIPVDYLFFTRPLF